MKRWIRDIAVKATFIALIVYGLYCHNEIAGNIALFLGWFFVLFGIVATLATEEAVSELNPDAKRHFRSNLWRAYACTADIAAVLLFAGAGHFVLAAFLACSLFLMKSALFYHLGKSD